ncbi:TPA: hypothetical protein ACPJDA_001863, partial [Haemophilus influenzae]
ILNNSITIFIILSFILIMFLYVIKITLKNIFSRVRCADRFAFLLLLSSVCYEMYILIENSEMGKGNVVSDVYQLLLLFSGIVSMSCVVKIFSNKKAIKNEDFLAVTGTFALMQAVMSMRISNSVDIYIFNVSFIHGAIYIIIPAFLIYEITPSNREALRKLQDDIQDIKNDLNKLNLPDNNKKIRKKFCKFF